MAGATWDLGFGAYDQAIGYGTCDNDNGDACSSITWAIVADAERGEVLKSRELPTPRCWLLY